MSVVIDRRHASTPQKLADWAIKRYGLELDVCASDWNHKLPRYYSLDRGEDGLVLPWNAPAWCNPPWHSPSVWLAKGDQAVRKMGCRVAVFCLPYRPGVGWWRKFVARAHPDLSVIIHEFEGRVVYGAEPSSVTGAGGYEPTVLVVFERRLRARDFNS